MSSYEELKSVISDLQKENKKLRDEKCKYENYYYSLRRKCIEQNLCYNILFKKSMKQTDYFHPECHFNQYLEQFNKSTIEEQMSILKNMRKLDFKFVEEVGYIYFDGDYEIKDFTDDCI